MADTLASLKSLVKDKRVLFLALSPVVTLLLYYFDTNIVSFMFSRLFLFLAIGIFKVSFLGLESSK